MTLQDIQNLVISLEIKFNQADLISDFQYLTEAQWIGVYLMLERMQGG